MFDFLPPFLKRLYRSLRAPLARGTRVPVTAPPEPDPRPDIAVQLRERMFRVDIINDAFCEKQPKPHILFRKEVIHRNLESWCDLEHARYPTTRHRCAHCAEIRELFLSAGRYDWEAEVRLHRLATRASLRLLAERRQWADTSRRRRAERTPAPPPPPGTWEKLGWARWRARRRTYHPGLDRWFVVERREAEARLIAAHAAKLRRMVKRKQARQRDAVVASRAAARPPAAGLPSSRVAQRGGAPRGDPRGDDPGQPGARVPRVPKAPVGSPRRQSAAREDGKSATDAPARARDDAKAVPAVSAPIAPAFIKPGIDPALALGPVRYVYFRLPGGTTLVRCGGGTMPVLPGLLGQRIAAAAAAAAGAPANASENTAPHPAPAAALVPSPAASPAPARDQPADQAAAQTTAAAPTPAIRDAGKVKIGAGRWTIPHLPRRPGAPVRDVRGVDVVDAKAADDLVSVDTDDLRRDIETPRNADRAADT